MANVGFTEKELGDNAKELYNSIEEYTWKLIQARLHKDLKAEDCGYPCEAREYKEATTITYIPV